MRAGTRLCRFRGSNSCTRCCTQAAGAQTSFGRNLSIRTTRYLLHTNMPFEGVNPITAPNIVTANPYLNTNPRIDINDGQWTDSNVDERAERCIDKGEHARWDKILLYPCPVRGGECAISPWTFLSAKRPLTSYGRERGSTGRRTTVIRV